MAELFSSLARVFDPLVRAGIRLACANRLRHERAAWRDPNQLSQFVEKLAGRGIAEETDAANDQHYGLPPMFFQRVLGKRLKYSCCLWEPGSTTLDEAEEAALKATAEFADLKDGQAILELGCGWGSLSLWMAEHYPSSQIVAVSNSSSQRKFIEERAKERGFSNLTIITQDINGFEPNRKFDRVVSVEMFEHIRNYPALFGRIATWVNPGARLFIHVFRHKDVAYLFETNGIGNWMGREFFTGGVMPSTALMPAVATPWRLEASRDWDGTHYQKTANAWLENLDANPREVQDAMEWGYGMKGARWRQRWRIFFMACAELFGYDGGSEWGVTHYRFKLD